MGHRAPDFFRELPTHVQPALVHGSRIHDRVGAGKVDVFEDAGREHGFGRALAAVERSAFIDEDGFAGQDVPHQLEAECGERDAFGSDQILGSLLGVIAAEYERTDSERVAEREQSVARDQGHHRVGAAATPMHVRHRGKDGLGVELLALCGELQFVREHVEQHFRVGVGIDVAQILTEHLLLQYLGIGQVAVVAEDDPERGVDIERLCLPGVERRPRGGITAVSDAGAARERAHVPGAKHVAHHPGPLVHVERLVFRRDDPGCVLAAVLQQQQPVVQQLIDRRLRHHSENAAHLRYSSRLIGTSGVAPGARAYRAAARVPRSRTAPRAPRRARKVRVEAASGLPATPRRAR